MADDWTYSTEPVAPAPVAPKAPAAVGDWSYSSEGNEAPGVKAPTTPVAPGTVRPVELPASEARQQPGVGFFTGLGNYMRGEYDPNPFAKVTPEQQAEYFKRVRAQSGNKNFSEAMDNQIWKEVTGTDWTEPANPDYIKAIQTGNDISDYINWEEQYLPSQQTFDEVASRDEQAKGVRNRFMAAYEEEAQRGFTGWLGSMMNDWKDTGKDQIRELYPDLTEEQLEYLSDRAIAQGAIATQRALQERFAADPAWRPDEGTIENLVSGRWIPSVVAAIGGSVDPSAAAIPGGSALARVGWQFPIGIASGTVEETLDYGRGLTDEISPENILIQGLASSGLQGIFEAGGRALRGSRTAEPEAPAVREDLNTDLAPVEGEPGLPGPLGMEGEAGIPGPRFTPKPEAAPPAVSADQAVTRINDIAKDWKNAPEIEVVNSVDDITDPVIKGSIDDPANTLGFLGEDGKVRIIAGNLKSEAEIPAILFHEALGHHGLAQKFGKDLDNLLTRMYESGGKFKDDVDEFLDGRPDYASAYADDPNPKARIVEEILAGRSETGIAVPPNILAKAKHYFKELGRKMGMNIEFNDLEVRTILGMAHDATINGKPTAASNGFRYSMEGERFTKGAVIDSRFKREDTLLRREVKKKNTEKSYEDWQRNWEFDNFIDELEANRPIGQTEQFEDLSGRGREGPVVQVYSNEELLQRLANGGPRYMKRQAGPGSEGTSSDMSRRAADEAESPYTGMGKVRSNRPDVPRILEEAAPTRDQQSWDEWIDASKEVRKSAEKHIKDLKSKKGGAEPADVIAARVGALSLANRISDLSRKIGQGMGTENDKYMLTQEMIKLADLEDSIAGVVGNAARIANSMKIEVASDSATNRAIRYMSRNLGSMDDVEGIARRIYALENEGPEAVRQAVRDSLRPLPEDYITSFRYSAMLSGLGTPVKAVVGTMSNMLFENIKDAGAVVIGGLKRPFTDAERLTATEWGARNVAMMKSIVEATKAAGRSFVAGQAVNAPDRLDVGNVSLPGSMVTEYPKRTLAAVDGFFREIIRGGEVNGLAVREAFKEGLEPNTPEWDARIDQLITNPTRAMEDAATKKADLQQLLDNDSWILRGLEAATRRRENMSISDRLGRFIVQNVFPFSRNIDNIMRQTLRNSPLGFLSKTVREDLAAGGARRDQAISRVIVGSTLLYFAGEYAANGLATGQGDSNLDMEALNKAAGRPANSVKIGDEWVSLEGFDAISAPFNAAASARIAWDRGEIDDKTYATRMLKAVGAVASSLYDTTIIEQMDKFTGLFDKQRPDTELAVSLPASFVPAAVRQYTQWGEDRSVLDTRGDKSFGDRVIGRTLSGLPGGVRTWIAEKLGFGEMPQRMDVFGRGVRREGDPLAAATGIGRGSVEDTDPAVQEVLRLSQKFGGALVTKTEDDFSVDGEKVKLSPTERQQWQYLAGQLILEEIHGAMNDPVWATLSDEDKADEIKLIVKDSKADIKEELFAKYLEPEEEEGVDDGFIYE